MATLNAEFGQRLWELAQRHGIKSQRLLAQTIGVSGNAITNYLSKGRVPEWDILLRIADHFGVTTDWLLTGKDSESRASPGPGQALIRLPRGETEPLSEHHADLLEKALVILRAQGDAAHFAASLETVLDSSLRGVRLANEQSGSPGEMAKRYKKGA